jgi:hypothetical protein
MKTKGNIKKKNTTCKKKDYCVDFNKICNDILELVKKQDLKSDILNIKKDDIVESLSTTINLFIKKLNLKSKNKGCLFKSKLCMYYFNNNIGFKTRIFEFRDFLMNLDTIFTQRRDTDILELRDEIVSYLDNFLCLFLSCSND